MNCPKCGSENCTKYTDHVICFSCMTLWTEWQQSEIQALKEEVERLKYDKVISERERDRYIDLVGVVAKQKDELQSALASSRQRERELVKGLRKLEWIRGLSHTCPACGAAEIQYGRGTSNAVAQRVMPAIHMSYCWLSALIEGKQK